jgi:hypothetical protein
MSTHVVNEFHAKPGRGDDVLALLLELSPVSRGRPGCEAISVRRNHAPSRGRAPKTKSVSTSRLDKSGMQHSGRGASVHVANVCSWRG